MLCSCSKSQVCGYSSHIDYQVHWSHGAIAERKDYIKWLLTGISWQLQVQLKYTLQNQRAGLSALFRLPEQTLISKL